MSLSQETTFSLFPNQDPSFLRHPDPYPISDFRDFLPFCLPLRTSSHPHCRRNQNYLDILRLLSLGDRQLSAFDISLRFTHLFWFGDLNYRLDMDIQVWAGGWAAVRWALTSGSGSEGQSSAFVSLSPFSPQEILNYISRKEFEPLLRVDQLNLEREKHKVFLRFSECGPTRRSEGQRSGISLSPDPSLFPAFPR